MIIGISCHPSAGGSGILATELALALAARGHTLHLVTYETPFRLTGFYNNVTSHVVDAAAYPLFRHPPAALALATKISEVAEEFGADIWHVHYAIPHAMSALLARDMLPPGKRFKIVTTLHGTDITLVGTDPSFFRLTKYAMESSDAVTAVSDWLNRETQREFNLHREIRTIYNFVDEAKFQDGGRDRCKLANQDEQIVMHISNFRPVKRVTDVVRAFKKIVDRIPARLVMVGDGPERMSAVGVARQLGIFDKLKFVGTHEHIESLLPCADLVFQPSEHESFGLVPLEAMACGVPVIGTNSGGIVEVVEHGVTGYLTEVGETDKMAEYALEILSNPERAREMGRRGRERALSRFAQERIVDRYEQLYHEVLNGSYADARAAVG